ncbi:MAG: 4a-hydroxytetrahydrobiopterin dehydratase [Oscillatoriales cyanobacterium RM2_1_1]|nr:4a-hydroxytetrahydrobiopterin dehydratase [Oscillatoriales cyanobacterium SM2_3_0]NJO46108.1 4a-hydroxytetrahydrobiopterin dehydratase [Oscillatoriales cyanobacterium RM2_1_1]
MDIFLASTILVNLGDPEIASWNIRSGVPFAQVQASQTASQTQGRLSEAEIGEKLQALPEWQRQDGSIFLIHRFGNFVESVQFVQCLVEPAERLGHHPDLEISYNNVTVRLTTHDVGGLTPLDFQVAQEINQILGQWTPETVCP